jgi:hypothetical protein
MTTATEVTIPCPTPIPDFLTGEFASKLAYLDEQVLGAKVNPGGESVLLRLRRAASAADSERLRDKLTRAAAVMLEHARPFESKVLEDECASASTFRDDPLPSLLELGEVIFEENGIASLGPLLTRMLHFFEAEFRKLGAAAGGTPRHFPTLIPASYLQGIRYYQTFPHSLTFATHLREDMDLIQKFAQLAALDDGALAVPEGCTSEVRALLSPAVCHHLYLGLRGKSVPEGALRAYGSCDCFRYESNNMNGLERLWNFTMWEVVFVGTADEVMAGITAGQAAASRLFKEWGLSYVLRGANDPFFLGEFAEQTTYQYAYDLKYEYRATLPFKESDLAIGSRNYHRDFFGRAMKITGSNGKPAHTGCVAFGMQRLLFALLAQHGIDPARWPERLRTGVEAAI